MAAKTARILLKIVPVIEATIPRVAKPTGCEDHEELIQDTIASAAEMLQSVEKAGKKAIPKSIVFYAIQRSRSGRRAYQCAKNDVLSQVFRAQHEDRLSYLDEPLSEEAEHLTLHDCIAERREDPASESLRKIDWNEFNGTLNWREKKLINDVAEGNQGIDTAKALGVSTGRVVQLKREVGSKIKAFMGPDILKDICGEAPWERDIRCNRQMIESRHAARLDEEFEPEVA